MDEKQQRLEELSYKWLNRTLTLTEKQEFELWFNQVDDIPLEIRSDLVKDKTAYKDLLLSNIHHKIDVPQRTKLYLHWQRYAVSVAAVILVTFGIWFYKNEMASRRDDMITNDIRPGTQGATLILANGTKIKLSNSSNGELATEARVRITKTADGQLVYEMVSSSLRGSESPSLRGANGDEAISPSYNTLSTGKGETYQVILPDGTKVWLNAASTLKFPSTFAGLKQRRVEITGEVYLEVAKDRMHPFIAETTQQQVEVLGTHFNISAYTDENEVKTTLLEGRVKIASQDRNNVVLKPGQQSIVTANKAIEVKPADAELAVAWKNNKFMFESESIQNIMKLLERWYNIEVIYEGPVPKYKFGGSVSKFDNISKVLKIMESSNKVHFKIEGRKVIVKE